MMSAFALTEASTQLRKPPNPNAIRMNSRSTSGECADVQCLPPRGYHTSESAINRPRMLSGSGHNGFDHTGETQGSYRQREDFFQDRKRCKVDNKQLVSDNRDNEMQASSHPNEGILHNRTRYEVIDSRFIAAHPHQPDYSSIRDINTGRNNCDPENSLQLNHRGSVAASCYPIPRELSSATFCGDKTLHHWGPGDKHRHDGSMKRTPSSWTKVEAPPPRKISDVHQRYEHTAARQPSSSFHHDSTNDPLQRTLTTYSSKQIPHLLWDPEDRQHLTDLHCFVRKYCIYIFSATHEDVENPRKGRKTALRLGQIGIGCLHCKNSESKLKGSTYFPTSLSGIYNATMIIQQRHFPVCPCVSSEALGMYNQLKTLTARSASTKEYWVSSAMKMGLYDTSNGVFFRSNNEESASRSSVVPLQVARPSQESLVRLVEPNDKRFATEYAYFVMEQMTTCVFTESDRLGKRKCHKIGFPGMACRHCYGGNGSGRFFPLTLKTFSDVSKSIHVLRNHLIKCTKAPIGMAAKVSALSDRHVDEKLITPFGSQKTFFDLIWKRLHPELTNISNSLNDTVAPPPPCIALPPPQPTHPPSPPYAGVMLNPRRASPSSMRGPIFRDVARRNHATYDYEPAVNNIYPRQGYATSTTHTMTTPLPSLASPPIVHRGKLSSRRIARLLNDDDDNQAINYDNARPSRQLCMIPKKRYLFSQRNTIANNANDLRLPSYPSSPPPPQQQHVAVSYSESDVSIAMILANGFGKSDDEHREPKNESNVSYS